MVPLYNVAKCAKRKACAYDYDNEPNKASKANLDVLIETATILATVKPIKAPKPIAIDTNNTTNNPVNPFAT